MAYPSRLQQLLDEGRVVIRSMIKYELGTGVYGVWNGKGSFEWGGVTYHGNQLVGVETIAVGLGTAALPMTIEMPEAADFGYTADKLASIEDEDYKGRPVVIYDVYIDPDSRSVLYVEPLNHGYVDTIDHAGENGEFKLVVHVETSALDNHRDGYRSASHEDQQLISAGDRGLEYASKVKTEKFDITL
ncbi:hypothetical protein [Ochrobactrum sp. SFR4]|uniref:hypothetical protein n=1 Tax=Ochrobactrum sp. SFR4 TaxID=2717368 RepID=UPI001C8C31F2|nr:hypothetical protein [Ochrobactrum sp. SFR4]MBX8827267.1 hypothetical protein [Ochrobactrum sp. SFR4]